MSKRNSAGSLMLLLGAVLALTGCGDDGPPGTPNPNPGAGSGGDGTAGSGGGAGNAGAGGSTAGSGATSGGGTGGAIDPGGEVECGSEPSKEGQCKPTAQGIYGIKTELDVWWGNEDGAFGELIDAGRGKLTFFLHGQIEDICDNGTDGRGLIRACGSDIPPFVMQLLCEAYKIEIPDSTWEQPGMPTFVTRGSTSGFEPGDILRLASTTGLLGIRFEDNPDRTWPTSSETEAVTCIQDDGTPGTGEECFPDDDGDGLPGMTVRMRNSGQYRPDGCGVSFLDPVGRPFNFRAPPIAFDPLALFPDTPVARADRVQVGVRVKLGGSGAIGSDCMSGTGAAEAEFFDSRAWGCRVLEGTYGGFDPPAGPDQACNPVQAEFLDDNLPIWKILQAGQTPPSNLATITDKSASVGPRAALVRLGDIGANVSCADVRNATYPDFN